jgi:hypothetical protein
MGFPRHLTLPAATAWRSGWLGRVLDEVEDLAPESDPAPIADAIGPKSKSFARSSKSLARTNTSRMLADAIKKWRRRRGAAVPGFVFKWVSKSSRHSGSPVWLTAIMRACRPSSHSRSSCAAVGGAMRRAKADSIAHRCAVVMRPPRPSRTRRAVPQNFRVAYSVGGVLGRSLFSNDPRKATKRCRGLPSIRTHSTSRAECRVRYQCCRCRDRHTTNIGLFSTKILFSFGSRRIRMIVPRDIVPAILAILSMDLKDAMATNSAMRECSRLIRAGHACHHGMGLAGRPSGQGRGRREGVERAGSAVCGGGIDRIKVGQTGPGGGVIAGFVSPVCPQAAGRAHRNASNSRLSGTSEAPEGTRHM